MVIRWNSAVSAEEYEAGTNTGSSPPPLYTKKNSHTPTMIVVL